MDIGTNREFVYDPNTNNRQMTAVGLVSTDIVPTVVTAEAALAYQRRQRRRQATANRGTVKVSSAKNFNYYCATKSVCNRECNYP